MNVVRLTELVAPRADRPATGTAHDSRDARFVVFRLAPGQVVRTHTNPAAVTLVVLQGRGVFTGAAGEQLLGAGDAALYAPGEPHGIRAADDEVIFLAVIGKTAVAAPGAAADPAAAPVA